MHLILTGATGLVGSAVLHHVLSLPSTTAASKKITRLSIISRRKEIPLLSHPQRPTNNEYTKIEVIPHTDFNVYPRELMAKLTSNSTDDGKSGGDAGDAEIDDDGKVGVIWALGISQSQVNSAAEYTEITRDYTLSAAKAFANVLESTQISEQAPKSIDTSTPARPNTTNDKSETNPSVTEGERPLKQVNFIYISGEGAQHTSGLFTPMFSKIKGQTELDLLELGKLNQGFKVYNVRPAGVDSFNQPAVRAVTDSSDKTRGLAYRIAKATVLPLLRTGVLTNTLSPTEELGRVFVDLATGDGSPLNGVGTEAWEGRVVRNSGLRRMFRESNASE